MNAREYYSIENQQRRIDEDKRLQNLEQRYRKELQNQAFKLTPLWNTDPSDIDFTRLHEGCPTFLENSRYSVYNIEMDELFRIAPKELRQGFDQANFWTGRNNDKIVRILEKWESGEKLIPVILNIPYSEILIQDGNHRLSVCCYLNVKSIPVIVGETFKSAFHRLADPDKITLV